MEIHVAIKYFIAGFVLTMRMIEHLLVSCYYCEVEQKRTFMDSKQKLLLSNLLVGESLRVAGYTPTLVLRNYTL